MVYICDLQQLIREWLERMNTAQPPSYKDALRDCIYDLNQLVDRAIEEEFDYKEMVESQIADSYLSSMEAHEAVA